MIFQIQKAGESATVQSCKEAFPLKMTLIDQRTFKTPEEHDLTLNDPPWFSEGTNHSVNKIGIVRDMEEKDCWGIELNSIEDLVDLYKRYSYLTIHVSYIDWKTIVICIEDQNENL
jgi:hypothetical protein